MRKFLDLSKTMSVIVGSTKVLGIEMLFVISAVCKLLPLESEEKEWVILSWPHR